MVGAVLTDVQGRTIGLGHHRRFGGPHAEREALADCRRRAGDPRGATMYVTLEPCRHHGKTPPCADALIEAGVGRVVMAVGDPNPVAGGGADVLRAAGIDVRFTGASPLAAYASAPFVKRVTTGLPWTIAKWAQTADGETRFGVDGSRWISGEAARRRVHRLRGRVDAIITGMGTVLADDPLLTARGLPRVRRVARRVLVTTRPGMSEGRILARTAVAGPVVLATSHANPVAPPAPIELMALPASRAGVDLAVLLRELVSRHNTTTVLIEAGATLLGSFLAAGLVDEAIVYVAGVEGEPGAVVPRGPLRAVTNGDYRMVRAASVGPDAELRFVRASRVPGLDQAEGSAGVASA